MKSPIDQLVGLLSKIPGMGARSARRAVLLLLKRREQLMIPLGEALLFVAKQAKTCGLCGNISVNDPCLICTAPTREKMTVCVVEDVGDLWALERSRAFKGLYHVLGGSLSALEGVRPEDLRIESLLQRIERGDIKEIILALNATMQGQTTAHYLIERLEKYPVKVSKLAHGLPIGGELDYLDEGTLIAALHARK